MKSTDMMNLAELAYTKVKSRIQTGVYTMNERIAESSVCEITGISRTPVRAALNRLEAEGFLVRDDSHRLRVPRYTVENVHEMYGCRAILEAEAVRLAIRSGLPAAVLKELSGYVTRMGELLENADDIDDPELRAAFLSLNHQFHNAIYDNCKNGCLLRLISNVSDLPVALRHYINFSGQQLKDSQLAHENILLAIKRGDGHRASSLMREHIWAARDRMVDRKAKRRKRTPKYDVSPRGKLILKPLREQKN